ncbi:hypothetical protein NQ314_012172 [Rhamnusium bicolor]|uniref:PiggyBac transposable element-derived protein domain-containing protein n=1 Tax=Rhamnusium bicolor TaxID=1586634 RepID=A0AAV8XCJ8_9CUCU|nr:hypothetical protein NQ314_012172 [Rhamnusium bicolor]
MGTVRKNRKGLDNSTLEAKLQKGEICSVQQQYMTFMKWRDQRDVLMISTCFGDGNVETGKDRRGNTKTKPKIIVEYNKGKQGVDISDQLSSYMSLRKSLVWYKKIAIDILCSTTVVNSHILYQTIVEKNMSLLQFTESVIRALLPSENNSPEVAVNIKRLKRHSILKLADNVDQTGKILRKRCHGCYMNLKKAV